jgi:alpha-L-fucosidase
MAATAAPAVEPFRQRPLPQWFAGAKFGVMVHWGPYSVPAWAERSGVVQELWAKKGPAYFFKHNPYAEWYENTMRIPGSGAQRHHLETYGASFRYDDFIPQFNEASARMDAALWGRTSSRVRAPAMSS